MTDAPRHRGAREWVLRSLLMLLSCAGCGEAPSKSHAHPPPPPTPPVCVHQAASALSVVDRSLIGSAADYRADLGLRAREDELRRSQQARRNVAWKVVERVLRPVALDPTALPDAQKPTIPAFQTWYARDDLSRVFARAYDALSPERRKARSPLSAAELHTAFLWNERAVDDFEEWTSERLWAYQHAVQTATQVSGLGGLYRVAYGASAGAHMLGSYGKVLDCRDHPPPSSASTPLAPETVFAGPLSLQACDDWALDPLDLSAGETLEVSFEHVSGEGLVRVNYASAGSAWNSCEPEGSTPCIVKGPASVRVSAQTDHVALRGHLSVLRSREPAFAAPCVRGQFPGTAVVVKADFRRAGLGFTLPTYDTSAAALEARLAKGGDMSWTEPDGQADPQEGDIYTIQLPNGNRFRLAALHIMTKELEHWLWVTLWWSPEPDSDFGADRPASLQGPLSHYKMCTVSAFEEGDLDPTGGYEGKMESLGKALALTHAGVGGPTWCSNPYLERGSHNASTNCIGCHQHAGSGLTPEAILADPRKYPQQGRTRVRDSFPSDYVYALSAGDDLGAVFQAQEENAASTRSTCESVGCSPSGRVPSW